MTTTPTIRKSPTKLDPAKSKFLVGKQISIDPS
uniref:Uncharacterized protein n=1 Tax=Solanum lycopersicum TaxID=4081 RepID=A0A3Q7I0N9_SOLLC